MKLRKWKFDMKILIACEESQVVCSAFRELGYEAYSCDIEECSGGHPEWHIHQGRDLRPFERYVKLWEKATGMVFKAANVGCMIPYMDYRPRTLEEIKKAKGWG